MSPKTVTYNDGFSEKWVLYLSPPGWRDAVDVQFLEVPLSRLEPAGCRTDPDVVEGWMRTLQDGKSVPPPVAVLTERGTFYLHDGNHRYEALTRYLAGDGGNPLVRIAVAVPRPDHEFVYRWYEGYATYVLQRRPRRFTAVTRAVIATGASGIALAATVSLPAIDHTPMYAFLVLSVMISGWAGGWKAGLFAAVLNCMGAAYFLLPPNGSLLIARPGQAVHFAVTALVMVAVALLMHIVRLYPSLELGIPDRKDSWAHREVKDR